MLSQLASDDMLDAAYEWLCYRRREYSANADVWSFRRDWAVERERLKEELASGQFRFGLLRRVNKEDGSECDLWSARDALILKALAIVLGAVLPVSPLCTHVKGHGGAKAAVRQVLAELAANRFVLRTDVKSYYASIDHVLLMDRLAHYVRDRVVLNLVGQYLRRTAERGGWFWEYERGISLGCPLSPLIGAFFLAELDERMANTRLFYVRFMDDILVMAPTRWKLRRAVAAVNQILGALRLEKHPDKTFIGKIARGFDFLGYRFGPHGLAIAEATLASFIERATRLFEQERKKPSGFSRFGRYVRRWVAWADGGLACPGAHVRLQDNPGDRRASPRLLGGKTAMNRTHRERVPAHRVRSEDGGWLGTVRVLDVPIPDYASCPSS